MPDVRASRRQAARRQLAGPLPPAAGAIVLSWCRGLQRQHRVRGAGWAGALPGKASNAGARAPSKSPTADAIGNSELLCPTSCKR